MKDVGPSNRKRRLPGVVRRQPELLTLVPVLRCNPLRIAILQHCQRPRRLDRRMAIAAVDDSELEYSTAPSVPATIPRAVGILVVKDAFHPSAPNQVRAAGGEDERRPLNIGVGNAEVI